MIMDSTIGEAVLFVGVVVWLIGMVFVMRAILLGKSSRLPEYPPIMEVEDDEC